MKIIVALAYSIAAQGKVENNQTVGYADEEMPRSCRIIGGRNIAVPKVPIAQKERLGVLSKSINWAMVA
jgi:hypothetical protein